MLVSKNRGTLKDKIFELWGPLNSVSVHPHVELLKHLENWTLATYRKEYDCELFLFFSFKTRKQIFTVEVEVMLVVANLAF